MKLSLKDSYTLKVEMNRAVSWLIDKINDSDLDPIEILPANISDHLDIHTALQDPRS